MQEVYAYIRVSTVKQGTHGVSLQEQKDAIEQYAQRHNFTITEWFEEKETAAKRGRPVFSCMLKKLRAGKTMGVIIHKIDRSARNLKDWADLNEILDRGKEVFFANEDLDLRSRGGRLSADIQAVIASDYIRNLKDEVKKGMYGRLKQGFYPLPAPIGYIDKGKAKLKEFDETMAPLVRMTFELYATEKYNLLTLAKEMYRLGLRNKKGGKVTRNGLSVMLNNPFYYGVIRLKSTGETFSGNHMPIISKALFDRVQAILHGKTHTKTQKHTFLFRKFLACKECGGTLTGETQKNINYYRCHTKECPIKCIREDMIEVHIKNVLRHVQFSDDTTERLTALIGDAKKKWEQDRTAIVKQLTMNLQKVYDKLDRLTDAYVENLLEKDLFERRKKSLILEQKEIEEKIAEIESGNNSVPDKLSLFFEQTKSLYSSYISGIPEEKREILENVISNRYVDGKKPYFKLKSPYCDISNHAVFSNSAPGGI